MVDNILKYTAITHLNAHVLYPNLHIFEYLVPSQLSRLVWARRLHFTLSLFTVDINLFTQRLKLFEV